MLSILPVQACKPDKLKMASKAEKLNVSNPCQGVFQAADEGLPATSLEQLLENFEVSVPSGFIGQLTPSLQEDLLL